MNKEQQELLNEAYKNYKTYMNNNIMETRWSKVEISEDGRGATGRHYTQEEFIGIVITNPDFAKHWGVTLYTVVEDGNIRIGINYKDKTIESYENNS